MHMSTRAAVLAAALLPAGGASGLVLAACGGSSTADPQARAGPSGMPRAKGKMGDPGDLIAERLDALVDDGTIAAARQTAIEAALTQGMHGASPAARPSAGGSSPQTY
ncbi:MAG: hypothetical protein WCP98_17820 [Actinomycetes bacterium]